MGREATITQDQVSAVCERIVAAGSKPTSRAVREALGTGSMGTISKMMQAWKASQVRQVESSLVLPTGIQTTILDFMSRELATAKAALQADLVELQQENADLANENERQINENAALTDELEIVRAQLATQEGRAGQMEVDLNEARDDATRERQAAEAVRTDLAKAQLRLEAMPRLEADLEALRGALEIERKARVAAEQSAAVLAAEKAGLESRIARLEPELDKVKTRLDEVYARSQKAESAAARSEGEMAALMAQLEQLKKSSDSEATRVSGPAAMNKAVSDLAGAIGKLIETGPKRSMFAQFKELFPQIEAAQSAGISRADIHATLAQHGLKMTMKSFESMLYRARQAHKE